MTAMALAFAATLHVFPVFPPAGAPKHPHSGMTCSNSHYALDMGIGTGRWAHPYFVTSIEKLIDTKGAVVGLRYQVKPSEFTLIEATPRMNADDRAAVGPVTVPGDDGRRYSIYRWFGPAHHSVAVPVSRFPFTDLRAVPCTGSDWSSPRS